MSTNIGYYTDRYIILYHSTKIRPFFRLLVMNTLDHIPYATIFKFSDRIITIVEQ